MISPTVRLRLKPCFPVEQKRQLTAQPACVEMHSVPRFSSGMKTVSTLPDVQQPLARAVGGNVIADDAGSGDGRARLELVPQGLCEIGHRIEIAGAELVDPALQLLGAKRLLTQLAAIGDKLRGIEIQQVGESHHRSISFLRSSLKVNDRSR